jgi:hypothetical protein
LEGDVAIPRADLTAEQQEVELNTVPCTQQYQYLKGLQHFKKQDTLIGKIKSPMPKKVQQRLF